MAKCFFKKSGVSGGSANYAHGTFTSSASTTTKVTLGFKPKSLAVMIVNNMNFYDESVSTTQFKFSTPTVYLTSVNLGNTTSGRLSTVDNDGFTVNKTSSAFTCYYHAVG